MNPSELRYSESHEWVRSENSSATVGITFHAQDQLGDVIFVSLPEVGSTVQQFAKMGEIESVKTVSDLISPVSGEVIARNDQLEARPELVNESPYGEGWLLKVKLGDTAQLDKLITAEAYEQLVGETTE
ncbi:MAG: glycine cleavage system protein GcvH [Chloroflexota bacterium]|nr:MAG: glycine cleavage system protein GcvH [Chloroflexota bacterium]